MLRCDATEPIPVDPLVTGVNGRRDDDAEVLTPRSGLDNRGAGRFVGCIKQDRGIRSTELERHHHSYTLQPHGCVQPLPRVHACVCAYLPAEEAKIRVFAKMPALEKSRLISKNRNISENQKREAINQQSTYAQN